MADVRIKIDIDADTSAIDRVRARMRQLCNEVDSCTEVSKKHTTQLRDLSNEQETVGRRSDNLGKKFRGISKVTDFFTKSLRALAKFGLIYVAVEAAAAVVVIASANLLFKAGSVLAKGYQAALSGVAYAMAGVVAVGAAFLAAQREFQAIQFAPAYSEGAINTTNNMVAASGAMKMFVDDTQLAVIGAKGLSSAFKTLSDQAPVTGQTTATFKALSDYTTGLGGDLEKSSQALAKFLAQYQKDKTMTSAVKKAGEELGPQFKKILEEANKMGVKTYEEFASAAIRGELGATFEKYDGQLMRVNSTLIGMFKSSFAEIKSFLVEIGEPLLQPIKEQIPRLMNIIKALLIQVRGNVQEIGSGSLLTGLVDVVDKMAQWIGRLASGDLGKAGAIIDGMRKSWDFLVRGFEKVQDYLRPLQEAGSALWRAIKPLVEAFGSNLNSTIQLLADSLVENEKRFTEFFTSIGEFIKGIGNFGNSIKNVFVSAMPEIGSFAETLGDTFTMLGKSLEAATPVIKTIIRLADYLLKAFNMVYKIVEKVGSAIEFILKPITLLVKVLTLGVVDITSGITSLIMAVTTLAGISSLKGLVTGKTGMLGKGLNFIKGKIGGGGGAAGNAAGAASGGGKLAKIGSVLKNPMVGKLAGSAAIAYGGYKLVDFTSSKFGDDSIKSRGMSAVAGAAGGAATGAAIGAMFGAGPGAVAGAVVGSIIGGVVGFFKAGKAKRDARKAANALVDSFSGAINDAIASGDVEGLLKAREEALKGYEALLAEGGYKASEVKKKQDELNKLNKQVDTYVDNAGQFEFFSGMDADKMNEALKKMFGTEEAAAEAAKNSVLNIFDVMRAGGIDVAAQWDSMMAGFNQSLLEMRLAMFDMPMQMLETQKAVDAAQAKILSGDTSQESVIDFLKKAYEYALSRTGGDALAATDFMKRHLDKAYGPGGSLEDVAGMVQQAADKLMLFDSGLIVKQLAQSGMLEANARAFSTITGGAVDVGEAELRIRALVGSSGENAAGTSDLINRLIDAAAQNQIDPGQLESFLSGPQGLFLGGLTLRNMETSRQTSGAGGEQGQYVPLATNAYSFGGFTFNIAGFIENPDTAKRLAAQLATEVEKILERKAMANNPAIQ